MLACALICLTACDQPAAPVNPAVPSALPRGVPATSTESGHPAVRAERPANDTFDIANDPFPPKSWEVPAAPPPPAPPPVTRAPESAPPVAPPLPFAYAGKLEQAPGQWTIYLTRGNDSFALSKGDTFDNVYRLVEVDAGKLVIEYLPLSTKQTLPIGTE